MLKMIIPEECRIKDRQRKSFEKSIIEQFEAGSSISSVSGNSLAVVFEYCQRVGQSFRLEGFCMKRGERLGFGIVKTSNILDSENEGAQNNKERQEKRKVRNSRNQRGGKRNSR